MVIFITWLTRGNKMEPQLLMEEYLQRIDSLANNIVLSVARSITRSGLVSI